MDEAYVCLTDDEMQICARVLWLNNAVRLTPDARDGEEKTKAEAAAAVLATGDSSTGHDQHSSDDGGGDASKEDHEALAARSRSRLELEALFSGLYPRAAEEDGMKTSRNERLSKGYESVSLTYGEVSATGVSCSSSENQFSLLRG